MDSIDAEQIKVPDDKTAIRTSVKSKALTENGVLALTASTVAAFELSEADKKEVPPSLSVFDNSLTTEEQAKDLTDKDFCFFLPVSLILGISVPNNNPSLKVVYKPPVEADKIFGKEGANGHSGILGLKRPDSFPKKDWKIVRLRLADIAVNNTPWCCIRST